MLYYSPYFAGWKWKCYSLQGCHRQSWEWRLSSYSSPTHHLTFKKTEKPDCPLTWILSFAPILQATIHYAKQARTQLRTFNFPPSGDQSCFSAISMQIRSVSIGVISIASLKSPPAISKLQCFILIMRKYKDFRTGYHMQTIRGRLSRIFSGEMGSSLISARVSLFLQKNKKKTKGAEI